MMIKIGEFFMIRELHQKGWSIIPPPLILKGIPIDYGKRKKLAYSQLTYGDIREFDFVEIREFQTVVDNFCLYVCNFLKFFLVK